MVDWLDPRHLVTTGLQALIARWVGQGRSMEETARSHALLEFGDGKGVWFDFMADTGDGWDSTLAMASLAAQATLPADGEVLPRGEFLLVGGDLVYPVPDRQRYQERFWGPFEAALPADGAGVTLLAIPGNHDWYDGLVSFSREFTQRRRVGGWQTAQDQSYFAARLPHGWWLWAMDVVMGARMDHGQHTYFANAAAQLAPGDRVILVAAEPDWIEGPLRDEDDSHYWAVEQQLIARAGAEVRVWLAGDSHHYRRHERVDAEGTPDPRYQRITSGGGGAYLTQTHRPRKRSVVVDDHEYKLRAAFPSAEASFRISFMVLGLAIRCWKFGIFPMGLLYWLLTWADVPASLGLAAVRDVLEHPATLLWAMLVLGGALVYADPRPRWFRWTMGVAHGIAHITVAYAVTGAVARTFLTGAPGVWDFVAASLLNFLAGMVCGPTVLGLYLWISLTAFGAHPLEAFSSLRIADYKHFLRFHVDARGDLRIYPVGVRKVARRGRGRCLYRLIERPVVVPR